MTQPTTVEQDDPHLCREVVHLAGEGPMPCGLELPCPRHAEETIDLGQTFGLAQVGDGDQRGVRVRTMFGDGRSTDQFLGHDDAHHPLPRPWGLTPDGELAQAAADAELATLGFQRTGPWTPDGEATYRAPVTKAQGGGADGA